MKYCYLSLLGLLLLTASCSSPTSSKELASQVPPGTQPALFKTTTYSLARLGRDPHFLDSLRRLPPADSSQIKRIIATAEPGLLPEQVDSTTRFYRYRAFAMGPYRAEAVAVVTDFNTLTASVQLLLFTPSNQWVSTTPLAFHYDEAGASEERTSVHKTPTTFLEQKVSEAVKEVPPQVEGNPNVYLGHETITTHALLRLRAGRPTITRLDSTYRLTKD